MLNTSNNSCITMLDPTDINECKINQDYSGYQPNESDERSCSGKHNNHDIANMLRYTCIFITLTQFAKHYHFLA